MKKSILLSLICLSAQLTFAQLVARVEITEDIPGLCNRNEVYALISPFEGQKVAVSPIGKEAILNKLNSQIDYMMGKPYYKDKGMVSLIINCQGQLIQCKMDTKTEDPELDKQVVELFNSLGKWEAGKLNGKKVDSTILYSFKIKKGKFYF